MLNNLILIYILALQDNKFYVTKLPSNSENIIDSFVSNTNITDSHSFFGNGAHWLDLYPIIKIDNIIKEDINCDNVVKYYMATYGAHNVRGCGFNDVVYNETYFKKLVKELNTNYERENLEGINDEEYESVKTHDNYETNEDDNPEYESVKTHGTYKINEDNHIIYSEKKITQCFRDVISIKDTNDIVNCN